MSWIFSILWGFHCKASGKKIRRHNIEECQRLDFVVRPCKNWLTRWNTYLKRVWFGDTKRKHTRCPAKLVPKVTESITNYLNSYYRGLLIFLFVKHFPPSHNTHYATGTLEAEGRTQEWLNHPNYEYKLNSYEFFCIYSTAIFIYTAIPFVTHMWQSLVCLPNITHTLSRHSLVVTPISWATP